ncbi:MAG: molybdenum cofactor biosysynthesis protein [Verrucomicrobia bacterium]|nr:molybdenum cofactor biosysynthesis protein [Verrucomicrobiota bacterium]
MQPPVIERLYVSPGHNFFGHHGGPAGTHPACAVAELRCRAGRGIEGDRFFDYKPDYAGQITFFEAEVFAGLCAALGLAETTPAGLRRNVVTRGLALEALAGREFCVQGVWFRGAGECKPCYWMDAALGPGAEAWLRGRGGLRARILTDGVLRCGAFGGAEEHGERADLGGGRGRAPALTR